MNKQQTGFTVIEGLLAALVAAVLIFGGYYVWHSQKSTKSTTPSPTTSTKAASSTASSTASTSTPASTNTTAPAAAKYLTITEWGVKAPYSGSLGLEYYIKNGYAYFSSTQLDASDPMCKSSPEYGGVFTRYKSTDEYLVGDGGVDSGQTAAQYAAGLAKTEYGHVGDYYFFYSHAQAACGTSDASNSAQTDTAAAVKALLPVLIAN